MFTSSENLRFMYNGQLWSTGQCTPTHSEVDDKWSLKCSFLNVVL